MGAATEDDREYLQQPERPLRRFVTAKYVCIALSCLALVLLAIALSYPISNLLGIKRLDDAYQSANVSDNEIDDTAPDGFQPTRDGYKRNVTETKAAPSPPPPSPPPPPPPESSTAAETTESTIPTTSTTESTTQPTTTTTVSPETTTTTTTEEPSTRRSTRRHRRSHREEPDNTTAASPTNEPSRPAVWLNRTRSPVGPSYVVYEVAMKKVSVQLIYECHCPRSRRFIVSQLLPVYELLREYMHLTLLPFGRARIENGTGGGNDTASNTTTTTPSSANSTGEPESSESAEDSGSADSNSNNTHSDGSNGTSSDRNSTSSPTIKCPRGEDECHGNMVQTCVMRHVEETLTAVRIIACMSQYPDPHRVGRRCVEKQGLEWHLVDQCVTEEGKLLMLDMGKKTWSITSSVNSVPLIRVEGEMSHVIQVEAQDQPVGAHMRTPAEPTPGLSGPWKRDPGSVAR
ncbi:mucin-5AC [Rhipicephalus sanguineus]|uniref:mucin-5AC n=1 Tax=Rhipicephalus sanguineus TaxID=34632 RepID=UPI0020C3D59A|nr:mucin-5AC [Rhipicephalus sanguineus]